MRVFRWITYSSSHDGLHVLFLPAVAIFATTSHLEVIIIMALEIVGPLVFMVWWVLWLPEPTLSTLSVAHLSTPIGGGFQWHNLLGDAALLWKI